MKMTRWCFSSAPSETLHFSNSPLRTKQPEVRPIIFLYLDQPDCIQYPNLVMINCCLSASGIFTFLFGILGALNTRLLSECLSNVQSILTKAQFYLMRPCMVLCSRKSQAHMSGCDLTDVSWYGTYNCAGVVCAGQWTLVSVGLSSAMTLYTSSRNKGHPDHKCMKTLIIYTGNKRISVPFNCSEADNIWLIRRSSSTQLTASRCHYLWVAKSYCIVD